MKMKLIAGERVILEEYTTELGGTEVVEGTEYFTEEGEYVGTLAATVGAYGKATGIFREVKGTCPVAEAEEILEKERMED